MLQSRRTAVRSVSKQSASRHYNFCATRSRRFERGAKPLRRPRAIDLDAKGKAPPRISKPDWSYAGTDFEVGSESGATRSATQLSEVASLPPSRAEAVASILGEAVFGDAVIGNAIARDQVQKRAIVCGAGGFIGGHLTKRLKREGFWVRGVDLKFHEHAETEADDFIIGDLRDRRSVGPSSTRASMKFTSSPPTWAAPAISSPANMTPTSCIIRRRSISTCSTSAQARHQELLLLLVGLHVSGLQPDRSGQSELHRGVGLSGRARQRIWLGEAVQRASLPRLQPQLRHAGRVARYP